MKYIAETGFGVNVYNFNINFKIMIHLFRFILWNLIKSEMYTKNRIKTSISGNVLIP